MVFSEEAGFEPTNLEHQKRNGLYQLRQPHFYESGHRTFNQWKYFSGKVLCKTKPFSKLCKLQGNEGNCARVASNGDTRFKPVIQNPTLCLNLVCSRKMALIWLQIMTHAGSFQIGFCYQKADNAKPLTFTVLEPFNQAEICKMVCVCIKVI